jgi:hypothetical protein
VAENVGFVSSLLQGSFSASRNGVLIYSPGSSSGDSQLTWFDRRGIALGTVGGPDLIFKPAISPDGSKVAVDRFDSELGTSDLWVYDLSVNSG